jgi:hypothetical protein
MLPEDIVKREAEKRQNDVNLGICNRKRHGKFVDDLPLVVNGRDRDMSGRRNSVDQSLPATARSALGTRLPPSVDAGVGSFGRDALRGAMADHHAKFDTKSRIATKFSGRRAVGGKYRQSAESKPKNSREGEANSRASISAR